MRRIISYVLVGGVLGALGFWAGVWHGETAARAEAALAGANAKSHTASSRVILAVNSGAPSNLSLDGLLHGGIHPDADALALWARGLTAQQRADALNSLQSLPAGQPRDDILRAVVGAWAVNDPKGFLAATDSVANTKMRETGVASALKALGAGSPQDALDWIKNNSTDVSNKDLSTRYESAMSGYATMDPQGALSAASALADGNRNDNQVKSRAMEGIAEGLSGQGRFTDAVALFNQLPANKFQNDGLARVADLWAEVAPQDTANWIGSVSNISLQNDLGQSLTDVWSSSDPAMAAKWAAQLDQQALAAGVAVSGNGNGNAVDSLLTNVIDTWSKSDLNAAGAFLNQQPPSPAKDSAIASFAQRAAQDDATAAMKWVGTIADPKVQQSAINQVANVWVKQDLAGFTQFIRTTTIMSDQQKQDLVAQLRIKYNRPANPGATGG